MSLRITEADKLARGNVRNHAVGLRAHEAFSLLEEELEDLAAEAEKDGKHLLRARLLRLSYYAEYFGIPR